MLEKPGLSRTGCPDVAAGKLCTNRCYAKDLTAAGSSQAPTLQTAISFGVPYDATADYSALRTYVQSTAAAAMGLATSDVEVVGVHATPVPDTTAATASQQQRSADRGRSLTTATAATTSATASNVVVDVSVNLAAAGTVPVSPTHVGVADGWVSWVGYPRLDCWYYFYLYRRV